MEDWRLEFPEIRQTQIILGEYPTQWFNYVLSTLPLPEDKQWDDLAEELFFKGGTIPVNKSLNAEYVGKGLRVLKAILCSYVPKHEQKEKVCGLILKSICS
jgi:hypothetical protein